MIADSYSLESIELKSFSIEKVTEIQLENLHTAQAWKNGDLNFLLSHFLNQ